MVIKYFGRIVADFRQKDGRAFGGWRVIIVM